MINSKPLLALATISVVAGFAATAKADPFADRAVSVQRVSLGTDVNGRHINTSFDDFDDGSDATGAPDTWTNENVHLTVLGIDQKGTLDPTDDFQGEIILEFTDNLCVDGVGNDLKIFEIGRDESAWIEVSKDNGETYVALGEATPENGHELDLGDALRFFNRVRITATDTNGLETAAGMDIDAVECLNSLDADAFASVDDGCDFYAGNDSRDVRTATVYSDGFSALVELDLCGDLKQVGDDSAKDDDDHHKGWRKNYWWRKWKRKSHNTYIVYFDFQDSTVLDGNDRCRRTADYWATYRDDGRETGGVFFAEDNILSLDVSYSDLGLNPGDRVQVWIETVQSRSWTREHVPSVEGGDRCSRPQHTDEVLLVTLEE